MKRRYLMVLSVASFTNGCALDSKVVPVDGDRFIVFHEAVIGPLLDRAFMPDAVEMARAHCRELNKELQVISNEAELPPNSSPGSKAEVLFQCVEKTN